MDRRHTLQWFGAAALGWSLPALALELTGNASTRVTVREDADHSPMVTKAVTCRVIGVGDAGGNIVMAAWSTGLIQAKHCQAEFAWVSMGQQGTKAVIETNRRNPAVTPIKAIQIGQYGAGGNVNVARTAARKHDNALRSLVGGAEVVILVAGLGGGTGSGVSPILAGMAQEAGAMVLGVIVTPFKWEIGRYSNAFQAVKELERECHFLASLSNQAVGEAIGGDATLDDVITQQEILGATFIHRLMEDGSRFCNDRRSRPT